MVGTVNMQKNFMTAPVVLCFITVSLLMFLISGVMAAAQSSGGDGSTGAGGPGSGQGGRGTQAAGSSTFGPPTGPGIGIAGGGQYYGPPPTDSFQVSQYGYPGAINTFNMPYVPEGATAYQQNQFAGVPSGPGITSMVPAPGSFASLQARGIVPGTCMWECTAEYTPIECQELCG